MTVKELIQELSKYNDDDKVTLSVYTIDDTNYSDTDDFTVIKLFKEDTEVTLLDTN